jgi:hypothetical protein
MQCVMFFGLQVDRSNLIQAVSDNMLDELGLSTNGLYLFNPFSHKTEADIRIYGQTTTPAT